MGIKKLGKRDFKKDLMIVMDNWTSEKEVILSTVSIGWNKWVGK